jgi:hypothetical protein
MCVPLVFAARPVLAGHPTPEEIQAFHATQADFRSQASKDSLYLVCIGIGAFLSSYAFMLIVRLQNFRKRRVS